MKMKHQTKEFWLTVRREFAKNSYDFLCVGSCEFKSAWKGSEQEMEGISQLAKEWLQKSTKWRNHESRPAVEFNPCFNLLFVAFCNHREIRKTFLNAMVKKFS